jgi:hypothetical protein
MSAFARYIGIDYSGARYFEMHGLKPDWSAFLADFQRHWPTDGEAEWLGKQALDECEDLTAI